MIPRISLAATTRGAGAKLGSRRDAVGKDSGFASGYACMNDGVWMTKAELAALRGISIGTANRLIRQRRWERQPGDDGRTRVLVPRRWAEARVPGDTAAANALVEAGADAPAERGRLAETIGALQQEVLRLRVELETAQSERRQAELARAAEQQAREAAERALTEVRQQAEAAEQAAEALRQAKEHHAAEERAEQVTREAAAAQLRRLSEAMAARRSLGRWARLRLAWRGD